MDDAQLHQRIEELVAEEHKLWNDESSGGSVVADRQRLEEVRVTLDRCWVLLRQRRALEESGLDPDGAAPRDANTVEHYQQ